MTNGNGRAWQVLYDLPSWQVTQIPRRPHARPGFGAVQCGTLNEEQRRLQRYPTRDLQGGRRVCKCFPDGLLCVNYTLSLIAVQRAYYLRHPGL